MSYVRQIRHQYGRAHHRAVLELKLEEELVGDAAFVRVPGVVDPVSFNLRVEHRNPGAEPTIDAGDILQILRGVHLAGDQVDSEPRSGA